MLSASKCTMPCPSNFQKELCVADWCTHDDSLFVCSSQRNFLLPRRFWGGSAVAVGSSTAPVHPTLQPLHRAKCRRVNLSEQKQHDERQQSGVHPTHPTTPPGPTSPSGCRCQQRLVYYDVNPGGNPLSGVPIVLAFRVKRARDTKSRVRHPKSNGS